LNVIRRLGDRLQAGSAQPIDCDAADANRKPTAQDDIPRKIPSLLRFRHRASEDNILNFRYFQLRNAIKRATDSSTRQIIRTRGGECFTRPAYRRSNCTDDNGFLHILHS
jgi:hypothetical protein